MQHLTVNGVRIDDTFAEAFGMSGTALIITAPTRKWARQAAVTMTGFATSVIGCGCEAAIDRDLSPKQTPDGRAGVRVLLFGMSSDALREAVANRLGQCVLTCPGSACFSDLTAIDSLALGDAIRTFADGFQISKRLGERRFWRLPVMDGEFVCEAEAGLTKLAVGGGNLLIMGATSLNTLCAAEAGVAAIHRVKDAIMPFPGGIVRSGSKVGSKYQGQFASTNDAFCPTLRGAVASALDDDIASVLEIVIDGLTAQAVAHAMRAGLAAILELGPQNGAVRVSAGNYGGKLGKFHFHLRELLP